MVILVVVLAVVAAACGPGGAPAGGPTTGVDPPVVTSPTPSPGVRAPAAVLDQIVEEFARLGSMNLAAVEELGRVGDARHGWVVSDLLRFAADAAELEVVRAAYEALTGVDPATLTRYAERPWTVLTNHLITADHPAPPDYVRFKAGLYTLIEPRWAPFFADADATIDWRWVSWGGVFIDDRPFGDRTRCTRGCIPGLDEPALTDAAGGAWYPDDGEVFGIVVGDEAVALPKRIMEVHEMVNMTLGGRRLGIPYCTLCGSAQAYLVDDVLDDGRPLVLRTSGLLSRSNKVTYDLVTGSVIDTFTGEARSGPLREAGVVLAQVTVEVATWAEWRTAHPSTRIIAEDGGVGRRYPEDPLRGRDDDGPIFPTGAVDDRLPAQESVVGVVTPDGQPVAFAADAAREALHRGDPVEAGGVRVRLGAGGLRAEWSDGAELVAHEAFWFAWSQFHPDTVLWTAP